MTIVLAAIDDSAAARPVLAVAQAVAQVLAGSVLAVHFPEGGPQTCRAIAREAGLSLEMLDTAPPEGIVQRAGAPDVACVVAGIRGLPAATGSVGHVARAVAEACDKPVVLVPPETPVPFALHRVLFPMEGRSATEANLASTLELVNTSGIEVVILNVTDAASLPMFMDQEQWYTEGWAQEFLARYVSLLPEQVRLELRVGAPAEAVLGLVAEQGIDLIALGWKQDLAPGRARLPGHVLRGSTVPVLLLPVTQGPAATAAAD